MLYSTFENWGPWELWTLRIVDLENCGPWELWTLRIVDLENCGPLNNIIFYLYSNYFLRYFQILSFNIVTCLHIILLMLNIPRDQKLLAIVVTDNQSLFPGGNFHLCSLSLTMHVPQTCIYLYVYRAFVGLPVMVNHHCDMDGNTPLHLTMSQVKEDRKGSHYVVSM